MTYGAEHRRVRTQLLEGRPFCLGYPVGTHGNEPVIATALDHREPVSRGGATTIDNADPLCGSCNSRKGRDERRRTWRDR